MRRSQHDENKEQIFARGPRSSRRDGCRAPGHYTSERSAITSIAGKIGCTAETLHRSCSEEASDRSKPAARAGDELDRLKHFEREVKELRRANAILREASAYFAMAELDRRERR